YILYYLYYCFFFFQAEDGIRDRNVTGVQTCALPIYGHYLGARKAFKGKLAIVNLDAHFDLRNERPSSGTMFYQILSSDEQVDYYCLGLQPQGNTQTLYDTADEFNVKYHSIDEVRQTDAVNEVIDALSDYD